MERANAAIFKKITKLLRTSRTIVISGHMNPDGDSVGSLLSLGLGLESLGKKVYMLSSDPVPVRYRLLPGAEKIISTFEGHADLAIAVDCSSKEILGDKTYSVFRSAKTIVEIDHHDFRRSFGDVQLIEKRAAAVGEIIFELLTYLKVRITKDIAQSIITSIIVETNSFRLPGVRALTFQICNKLMSADINFYKLVDMVFWSKRKESVILSGICLSRCKFKNRGTIVWSIITKEDLRSVHGTDDDVDAVPDEMRAIKRTKVAVLFREKEGGILRVSLRSKGKVNVAAIAEQYNGGGHYDIAGCNIPNDTCSIKNFLAQIERVVK